MTSNRNLLILAVLAAAYLLIVYGAGFIGGLTTKDPYYEHTNTLASQTVAYGQPLVYTVHLTERVGGYNIAKGHNLRLIQDCDEIVKDASGYQPNKCRTFTDFNVRSMSIAVDGKEVADFASYPTKKYGVRFQTQLTDYGVACYLDVCGSGAPRCGEYPASTFPYLLSRETPPLATLNDTDLITVTIPQYLPPGLHNIEIYTFSESSQWHKDATCGPSYPAGMNRGFDGGRNEMVNYHDTFLIKVTAGTASCPGTMEGNTCHVGGSDCAIGQFSTEKGCAYFLEGAVTATDGTQPPPQPEVNYTQPPHPQPATVPPPPPQQDNAILIAAAIVIAGWWLFLRKNNMR